MKMKGTKVKLPPEKNAKTISPAYFYCLILWFLAASGCLSIENRVALKQDGSGTLEITYKLAAEILTLSADNLSLIPLPLLKQDFQRVLSTSQGLKLKSYRQQVSAEEVLIRADITFQALDELSQLWGEDAQYLSLRRDATGTKLEMAIPATNLGLSEDSRQMMAEFFSTDYFSYQISVPDRITSFNEGRLVNINTFYYQISIYDIFKIRDGKKIILTW